MWLALYPHFTDKTFVTFGDYKNKLLNKKKEQTEEEMIAVCKMLNAAFGGEVIEND